MGIAAELCIFTNDRFTIDEVEGPAGSPSPGDAGPDGESAAAADDEV
jgi:hypothetical protein